MGGNASFAFGTPVDTGNAGNSSEPHLHFDLWGIDANGLPRPWPMRFRNLRPKEGKKPLAGTPTTGEYDTT